MVQVSRHSGVTEAGLKPLVTAAMVWLGRWLLNPGISSISHPLNLQLAEAFAHNPHRIHDLREFAKIACPCDASPPFFSGFSFGPGTALVN